MRLQLQKRVPGGRLPMIALTSKHIDVQVLPNLYVRVGVWDIALDAQGVLISSKKRTAGYIVRFWLASSPTLRIGAKRAPLRARLPGLVDRALMSLTAERNTPCSLLAASPRVRRRFARTAR